MVLEVTWNFLGKIHQGITQIEENKEEYLPTEKTAN